MTSGLWFRAGQQQAASMTTESKPSCPSSPAVGYADPSTQQQGDGRQQCCAEAVPGSGTLDFLGWLLKMQLIILLIPQNFNLGEGWRLTVKPAVAGFGLRFVPKKRQGRNHLTYVARLRIRHVAAPSVVSKGLVPFLCSCGWHEQLTAVVTDHTHLPWLQAQLC